LSLPPLGFGCAPIGNLYEPVSDEEAQGAMCEAFAKGIRYFDTAPFYGYGLSETRLGRALSGLPRHDLLISTKVGRCIEADAHASANDGFSVSGHRAVFDYSRAGIMRSIEASLDRLSVDHIDILLLHDVGKSTHGERHSEILRQSLDEALPAMAELKESGVIGAIGLGVNEQSVCLEIMPRFDLDCILLAGRYTLLEQHASAEVMAEGLRRGVKVIAAGPYNSGLLADERGPGDTYDYQPVEPATLHRTREIYALCASEGVDVGAAALQFPLAHPAVATVLPGLRSRREVDIATKRLKTCLPTRVWTKLQEAGLLDTGAVIPGPNARYPLRGMGQG
jgi:D-threo-aldose 1-dehydrogenase